MKLRYILPALLAFVMMLTGCSSEYTVDNLKSVQVSSSYVAINKGGGETEITLKAQGDWYIERVDSKDLWFTMSDSIGTAGSTRTNAIASSDSVSTLLFNTAGMSTETANEMVDELNKEKIKNGKSPINPIREYTFDRDGKMIKRELHDVREIFPVGPMARAVQSLSYTTVKLRFLDFLMRKQEMNLEVNYNKNIR